MIAFHRFHLKFIPNFENMLILFITNSITTQWIIQLVFVKQFFFRLFRTGNIFIEYEKIEFESIWNLKKIHPLVFTFVNRRSYMNSLFIAYKNNAWCLSMVRTGCQRLFYFFFVCAIFFIFFLFFLFFAESTTSWGIEVNLSLFTIKWEVVYRFITRGGFFQPYLATNVTSWVQFGEYLCFILSPFAS